MELKIEKESLWTKQYILILLVTITISATMSMMMPTLPIYIKKMGGSPTISGVIVSIFTFSALLCRPFFGNLMDKKGRKIILVIGAIVTAVSCFAYNLAAVIVVLLIVRVIHGIGYSAHTTAAATMAADVVPASRRGEGIGFFGGMNTAALALGPAIGLFIVGKTNFGNFFVIAAIICLVGFLAALLINYESESKVRPSLQQVVSLDSKKASYIEKTALPSCYVLFFVLFAYGGLVTFLPGYVISKGIHNPSMFFVVCAATLLLTRIFVGRITDRYGFSKIILPGILSMVVGFILLASASSLTVILIVAILYGFGYGAIQPTLNAIVVTVCSPKRKGAASATFFSTMDLGIGLGALIWGIISQRWGLGVVYYGCAVSVAMAYGLYLLTLRKQLKA